MLEKVKSYIIILLVLSLGFTPSVNASSDIFDEPRHVDYETYKNRMIEYIETPDYLKASMPPIVGRNEYGDSSDIFLAVDDLLTVVPVDEDMVESVQKTTFFRNMNTILVNKIKETREIFTFSDEEIPKWTDPYVRNANLAPEAALYNDYNLIAGNIQDIIHDTFLLEESGYPNIFRTNGNNIIDVNGVSFTFDELFARIQSATVLPNGYYRLNDIAPLASGQAPPNTISVDKMLNIMNDNVVVAGAGKNAFDARNGMLNLNSKGMVSPPSPVDGYKTPADIRYPAFIMDKTNPNTIAIVNNRNQPFIGVVEHLDQTRDRGNKIDVKPESINANNELLGLRVNANNEVEGERLIPESESASYISAAETGIMFILAIITLILAFVYR
jgi:hypothetical protein